MPSVRTIQAIDSPAGIIPPGAIGSRASTEAPSFCVWAKFGRAPVDLYLVGAEVELVHGEMPPVLPFEGDLR